MKEHFISKKKLLSSARYIQIYFLWFYRISYVTGQNIKIK